MAVEPLSIACPHCKAPLTRVDIVEQTAEQPRLEFYQCAYPDCPKAKWAVMWERGDRLGPPEPGFVQREIARRGAFFPADFQPMGRGPRNW